MKNTDIAMIILVAAISVVGSYFLGNLFLGDPNDRVEELSYMEKISGSIEQPHDETFNYDASNPTVEVYVGNCGPLEVWSPELKMCLQKTSEGVSEGESGVDESSANDAGVDEGSANETGSNDEQSSADESGDE